MKGISPMIGVVLLIGITFGIFIILYSWGGSYVKSSQQEYETGVSKRIECTLADITANYAVYNSTSQNFSIVVTNSGNVDFDYVIFTFIREAGSEDREVNKTLRKGEKKVYEISFANGCDVTLIRVSTPCPDAKDDLSRSEITFLGC